MSWNDADTIHAQIPTRIESLTFQRNAADDIARYQIKRADRLEAARNNWRTAFWTVAWVAMAAIGALIAEAAR